MFCAVVKMEWPLLVEEGGPHVVQLGRFGFVRDGVVVAPFLEGFEGLLK